NLAKWFYREYRTKIPEKGLIAAGIVLAAIIMLVLVGQTLQRAAPQLADSIPEAQLHEEPRPEGAAARPPGGLPAEAALIDRLKESLQSCDRQASANKEALILVIPVEFSDASYEKRVDPILLAGSKMVLESTTLIEGYQKGYLRPYPSQVEVKVVDIEANQKFTWPARAGIATLVVPPSTARRTVRIAFNLGNEKLDAWSEKSFSAPDLGACLWIGVARTG